MAVRLVATVQWQEYIAGVLARVNHHAPHIRDVISPLITAVLAHHNPLRPVQVRTHLGNTSNTIWFFLGERRYVLTYSHTDRRVLLLLGSLRGPTLAWFDNATARAILPLFADLAAQAKAA